MEWWKRNDKTVGSFEANGYRLYAITSNVWEWCLNAYDEDYYNKSPEVSPLAGDTDIEELIISFPITKELI